MRDRVSMHVWWASSVSTVAYERALISRSRISSRPLISANRAHRACLIGLENVALDGGIRIGVEKSDQCLFSCAFQSPRQLHN